MSQLSIQDFLSALTAKLKARTDEELDEFIKNENEGKITSFEPKFAVSRREHIRIAVAKAKEELEERYEVNKVKDIISKATYRELHEIIFMAETNNLFSDAPEYIKNLLRNQTCTLLSMNSSQAKKSSTAIKDIHQLDMFQKSKRKRIISMSM